MEPEESRIGEGRLMPDHMHMMISIPPKYAVSQVVGFIQGKSAIQLARVCGERKQNSLASTSGCADIWCPRWVGTKLWFANTFATRKWKTSG